MVRSGKTFQWHFRPLSGVVSSKENVAVRRNAEGKLNVIALVSRMHSDVHAKAKTKRLTNPPRESEDNTFLLYMLYYSSFFFFLQNVALKETVVI